ncbi:MAG: DUF5115 domain-containing protein [Prevotella sp.]|nr:DUF5115 domain-containing protein [Prevotella sp.]
MTKKILLGIALVASLAACTDDYKDWLDPQVVGQPEKVSFGDGSISTVGVIDFNNITDEFVKVCNISAPTSSDASYTPSYTISLGDQTFPIDAAGMMSAADLQNYIISLYGRRPVERTLDATVSMWLSNGATTVKTATSDVFHIIGIPKAPQISQNYYIVGGPNDWFGSAQSKELKFNHSGKDVYEDPVFSVVFKASEGDTWFAIGDDEACDAIANDNDWSKLFGTTKGNGNSGESGTLDRRYNLSDDGSFCVPAGGKLIKVTINMMDYSYQIESLNISENYYLIGGPGEWNNSKDQKFSHSDKSVFEDPVFTYTFASTGGEMWFAFGDDEAIDAVGEGTWNKLFGTTGDSKDLSGSFDRRYNLDGDHSFCVDGSAKYYRFSVNMMTMTYEITPLNFSQYVYFIGATDGWANAEQKLESPNMDGVYTGYVYCADPNGWGNEFKFQRVAGSWDDQINSGTFSGGISGDFADGGDNIKATAGEGIYYVTLDLANNTLNAVRIYNMNLVGDFNGWNPGDDAQQMTWDANEYCYVITNAGVTSNGWKFTANNDWGINLGYGESNSLNDLVGNGGNITVAGSTIKLYPTRKTSGKIYCTVE